MMDTKSTAVPGNSGILDELAQYWRSMPGKWLFLTCVAMWFGLFYFLGNAILGYHATPSLFSWLSDKYSDLDDNGHCQLIPFVVLGLYWWKRKEIMAVPKSPWWPASALLALALLMHVAGFMIQQTLISAAAFFLGLYALMGMAWGFQMLRASFFPFFLFVFALPLSGEPTDRITVPLRFVVTAITAVFSNSILGIHVIQDGTRIFNASGSYQYEVAAACSGMRSLVATFALAVIFGFVTLKSPWRRAVMIASAFPLAIVANVFRLTTIIVAAEAFGGQSAGNYVHNSSWMSLLPYIPTFIGLMVLGHFLREDRPPRPKQQPIMNPVQPMEQKS